MCYSEVRAGAKRAIYAKEEEVDRRETPFAEGGLRRLKDVVELSAEATRVKAELRTWRSSVEELNGERTANMWYH